MTTEIGKQKSRQDSSLIGPEAELRSRPAARSPLAQWLLLAIFLLILGGAIGWYLYSRHKTIDSTERRRLSNQAAIVERNLLPQLLLANRAIEGVLHELPAWRERNDGFKTANHQLQVINDTLLGIRPILVIDADGKVSASSENALIGMNFAQRDTFQTALKDPDPSVLHVSAPFKTVLDTLVISFFRTVTGTDGKFAGIVMVSVVPEYFSTLLDSVRYSPSVRTSILHGDGKLFLSSPPVAEIQGMNLATPGSLFTRHRQSNQPVNLFVDTVKSTGEERMLVQRTVQTTTPPMDKPLVIAVGRDTQSIFAPWREDLYQLGAMYGVVVIIASWALSFHRKREQQRRQTERAQEVSEDQLRLFYDQDIVGLTITSPEKGWIRVNAHLCRMLEYSEQELRRMTWAQLTHPDDLAADLEQFDKLLANEIDGYRLQKRFITRSGKVVPTNLVVRCVRTRSGAIDFVTAMVENMTEQEQAKKAQSESEYRYRCLVELTPEAIVVHRHGKFVYVNPAAIKMFAAASASDLLGAAMLDRVHPDFHQVVLERVKHYSEHGGNAPMIQEKFLKLDGTVIDVEAQGTVISYGGEPAVQVVMHDITERKKVEVALKDSEQRYRTLVEWSPESIIVHRRGKVLYANPAAVKMLGATSARNLVGKPILDWVHPDIHQAFLAQAKSHMQSWLNHPMTVRKLRKVDGTAMDAEVQGTIISYDGKPAVHVAMRDVTERLQIEAALKDSEQRYRTLVEWTPEPIIVHRRANILYVNPSAQKMFGASSVSELIGTSLLVRIHPDFYQVAVALMNGFAESDSDSPMVEQKFLRLDGTVIDVEIQGMAISYQGELARQASLRDVTERKRVEAALKDSEHRYRTLVEWTPEPLVVHRDRKILYVNPAAVALFGAGSAQALVGESILERISPESLPEALARETYFNEHGFVPGGEQRFCKIDGTPIDVEVQSSSISYDGAPAVYLAVRDITAAKAIEATLKAARLKAENASQAKSRFLASASHDLRQPAHALGMFVARLAELPHDSQTRHLVDSMDASVRAMQDMLDGLFDISRLDSDQTQIRRVAFPIEGTLRQLRSSLSSAASEKGLRLRIRPSKAWIESDPALLQPILLNLVSNAIRYTQQGSILVACRPTLDGTQLRIEVRDSGVGIAPEHHEEIFQEFFQVDNPQRDRNKGLGVGLSIVDRACRLLEHPHAIRSAPGCGSCFTVTLPLVPARAGGAYEESNESAPQTSFNGLRVLLIEDDALGRVGLASLLSSWGCSVTKVEGAKAACELYRDDQAPDFIISDFRLGGRINGIEAVDLLSAIAGRPIVACLISGDTDANVKEQAQAAGLPLLQKPVRPAKLRSLMRHLVQARSLR